MSSSEVKVGAVTLGGAAILAAMITFLGTFSFGSDKYNITIDYPQVGGLMAGNMVRYAGVQVGTVKGLTVSDSGIEVVAEINDNVQIPQEATFTIGADGILGEKFVDIQLHHRCGRHSGREVRRYPAASALGKRLFGGGRQGERHAGRRL